MVKAELDTSLLQLHNQEQVALTKVLPLLQATCRYLSAHGCKMQNGPDSSMMTK